MGCTYFFDEKISLDNELKVQCTPHHVEVIDNHSVPEIVIKSVGSDSKMGCATFYDWEQVERFVESVNDLRSRLAGIHKQFIIIRISTRPVTAGRPLRGSFGATPRSPPCSALK